MVLRHLAGMQTQPTREAWLLKAICCPDLSAVLMGQLGDLPENMV